MSSELSGKRVAFMMAQEGVEEVELTKPWEAVKDAGGTPELIAPEKGEVQAFNHLDKASTFQVDRTLGEVQPGEYDAVVLPGGVANPDELRLDERAVRFLQQFFSEAKPVGVICHGPWTLVEGDLVRERTITSWPSLKTDIRNAGGHWLDEEVVVDQGLVSSRKPEDLPAFCAKIVEEFREGRHQVAAGVSGAGQSTI
jgi:deglycase